jgi:hypothetical protein
MTEPIPRTLPPAPGCVSVYNSSANARKESPMSHRYYPNESNEYREAPVFTPSAGLSL